MNERIRELADQAGLDLQLQSLKVEKFTQLIVRECITVMYDNAIERKVPPDIDKTPTQYAIAVLEHFGVEK